MGGEGTSGIVEAFDPHHSELNGVVSTKEVRVERIKTLTKAITFVLLAAFGTWAIYSALAMATGDPQAHIGVGYFACWGLSSYIERGFVGPPSSTPKALITATVARHRLPAVYSSKYYVASGKLEFCQPPSDCDSESSDLTFDEFPHSKTETSLFSAAAIASMKWVWAASSTKNVGRERAELYNPNSLNGPAGYH
jgi:hypothetical protein